MQQRQQINLRVSKEEKDNLEKLAMQRGVSMSDYIREKVFSEEKRCIYDVEFRKIVNSVCVLLPHVDEMDLSEELKETYSWGGMRLWQYLSE